MSLTPPCDGTEHVDGEGHTHLYIDGEKITRVYSNWYYLGKLEPGEHTIRVHAICPGLIDGRWAREGWGDAWNDVKAMVEAQAPLSVVSTPADVARSIVSVITGTDVMTGQIITLDGGFTIN